MQSKAFDKSIKTATTISLLGSFTSYLLDLLVNSLHYSVKERTRGGMSPMAESKYSPTENVIYHVNTGTDGGNEILKGNLRTDRRWKVPSMS